MPRASKEINKCLKPYVSHGVQLSHEDESKEAIGDCPFCGKEKKFFVNALTGLYQCKVCGTGNDKGGGNSTVFLRELWKLGSDSPGDSDLSVLAAERKLLFPETLIAWEVVMSPLLGEWLLPGYSATDGRITQLYRYSRVTGGKMALLATPETPHALHGVNLFDRTKSTVYVCEGPWDAMALWEVLGSCREGDDGELVSCGLTSSLLKEANVVAVPGCNVWQEGWSRLLAGKDVVLLYDSDHPREANGKVVEPAGWAGMRRVCQQLSTAETPPASIRCLRWGLEGYDSALKSGYDVRDLLSRGGGERPSDRFSALRELLSMVDVIPDDWVKGRSRAAKKSGSVDVELLPCTDWRTMRTAWLKAMKWTDGLDYALAVMLAVTVSTDMPGTPAVWAKIVGPPACGKSTLCEALSTSKRYVRAESVITGFHSGWKTDAEGDEDHSLVAKLNGKTLITKDGDTLLQSPNKSQILSEGRDLYDGVSRVHYRHGMNRQYEDLRITWLLCGTESLRQIDESELGERFLDCVLMEGIDPELERDINARVVSRQFAMMTGGSSEVNDHEQLMSDARRLTGGYLEYLRDNFQALLGRMAPPPEEIHEEVSQLALYVAHLRARPSKKQVESDGREMSNRLAGQLARLAMCLALTLGEKTINERVMKLVRKVATDTARGVTSEICLYLFEKDRREGATSSGITTKVAQTQGRVGELLRFLKRIGVVETFDWTPKAATKGTIGGGKQVRWRLTDRMNEVFKQVHR